MAIEFKQTYVRDPFLAARRAPAPARQMEGDILVSWSFVSWLLTRLVAVLVLVGAAWAVYHAASSAQFQVRTVRVEGNSLLSQADVEGAAAVRGANIFWVNRGEVEARLRALGLVQRVEVTPVLPDTIKVRVVERKPAAHWVSGGQTYLVDREGVILKTVDSESDQATSLPTVVQVDGQPLTADARVDAGALRAATRLAATLPTAGVTPLSFAWSQNNGLEVATDQGFHVRFDRSGDLPQQISALRSVRDHLASTKKSAELIDVRFGDRPYFR